MPVNLPILFTRLGRIMGAIDSVNAFSGDTNLEAAGYDSVGRHIDEIRDEFTTSRTDLITGLYQTRDAYRNVHSGYKLALKQLAENVLIQMVHDDTELPALTVEEALKELIKQMKNSGDDVDANTVTGSVAAITPPANTGNPSVVVSVIDEYGRTLEYSFAENVIITCTLDSVTGGATARRETYSAKGEFPVTDKLAWDWLINGSGCNKTITSCDPSENAGTNLLTNSDYEDFTVANTPDKWPILVGVAGTTIFEDTDEFEGAKALRFQGDGGGTLHSIYQSFGDSGAGTAAVLEPNTVYALNFWGKRSTGNVAGVLTVDLYDNSAGAVMADDAGTSNTLAETTTAGGGWTTSYTAKSVFFRTPKVLPASYRVRLRVTTALTSGESIFIDELAMCEATQLYTAGPYVAIFGGSTNVVKGDDFSVTIANDYGGGAFGGLQTMAWALFDPTTKTGIPYSRLLPSDSGGTETIADTLRSAV